MCLCISDSWGLHSGSGELFGKRVLRELGPIVEHRHLQLELYQLDTPADDAPTKAYRLHHLTSWNHNYLVVHLATFDDYILVGDQISSISLVKVIDKQLRSIARDYGPLWPVGVDASSENDIIAANVRLIDYRTRVEIITCCTGRA